MKQNMETLTRRAYAKINLGLDVVGRLENGYHEVRMIMQSVGLYDVLTFRIMEEGSIRTTENGIRTAKNGIMVTTDEGGLPTDEGNLVYKAARLLMDACHVRAGVAIHLEKHIPIAAGMAGGSSDAAATLQGLNELFALGQSPEELRRLGVRIGADVPYCLMGGTALAEGIGEVLTPLPPMPRCSLLVAKPDIQVSTRHVYGQLDAREAWQHPDIDGLRSAIHRGDLAGVAARLGNVLEIVTAGTYPIILQIKQEMLSHGALGSLMSGSGPTVFGIYDSEGQARAAGSCLAQRGLAKDIFVTGPV